MEQTNFLQPSKTYLIRKDVMKNTPLYLSTKDRDFMVYDLRRFILPIGHLLAYSFNPNGLAFVVQFHSENILRRLPRNVCDQNFLLSAADLDTYLSDEYLDFHDSEFTCSEQDPRYILKKKVSNMLHAIAKSYNRIYLRKDRFSHRKLDYTLLESEDDIRKSVAEVLTLPVRYGETKQPEKSKYSSLKDTFSEYSDVLNLALLKSLFGESMEKLKGLLKTYKKKAVERLNLDMFIKLILEDFAEERHLRVVSGPRKGFKYNDP